MDGFSLANWESEKMEYLVRTRAKEREKREKEEFKKEKAQLKDEKPQLKDEKAQLKDEKAQFIKEKEKFMKEKHQKEEKTQKDMIKIIKKMLDNGLDYDMISKISGKTINEIKEIEKI